MAERRRTKHLNNCLSMLCFVDPRSVTYIIKHQNGVAVLPQREKGPQKMVPFVSAFWDCSEKKLLGTTKAECSVTSEWSPDGCYFMTATTAPRLQIDNAIKIFHPNGSLYYKKLFDKLYQAEWKPEAAEKFGDISNILKSVSSLKIEETKTQDSKPFQSSTKTAVMPAQKPAAYRPPHAKSAAAVQAELFGQSSSEEMSKNALRNKKRREKQREKKAAESSSTTSVG